MLHPDKCDCRDCRPDLYTFDDSNASPSGRLHRSDWQQDYEDERLEEYLETVEWIEAEEQVYRSDWLAVYEKWVKEGEGK
jgi:hypothetical protein